MTISKASAFVRPVFKTPTKLYGCLSLCRKETLSFGPAVSRTARSFSRFASREFVCVCDGADVCDREGTADSLPCCPYAAPLAINRNRKAVHLIRFIGVSVKNDLLTDNVAVSIKMQRPKFHRSRALELPQSHPDSRLRRNIDARRRSLRSIRKFDPESLRLSASGTSQCGTMRRHEDRA